MKICSFLSTLSINFTSEERSIFTDFKNIIELHSIHKKFHGFSFAISSWKIKFTATQLLGHSVDFFGVVTKKGSRGCSSYRLITAKECKVITKMPYKDNEYFHHNLCLSLGDYNFSQNFSSSDQNFSSSDQNSPLQFFCFFPEKETISRLFFIAFLIYINLILIDFFPCLWGVFWWFFSNSGNKFGEKLRAFPSNKIINSSSLCSKNIIVKQSNALERNLESFQFSSNHLKVDHIVRRHYYSENKCKVVVLQCKTDYIVEPMMVVGWRRNVFYWITRI